MSETTQADTFLLQNMQHISECPTATVAGLLAHASAWHDTRAQGLGGSDARTIMSENWLKLWEEKTGRRAGEDLSDKLNVQMGTWTEPLNRWWFEKQTGIEVKVAETAFVHPDADYLRANVDGLTVHGVFEAKHTAGYRHLDDIYRDYYPQCQHIMLVTGAEVVHLSVFFGNNVWDVLHIKQDKAYMEALAQRAAEFWAYVETDTPPAPLDAYTGPPPPLDDMRVVNAETATFANSFATHAVDFLQNQPAAKVFENAKDELKALVGKDVKRLHGFGVEIVRNKKGSLITRATKAIGGKS